jgi:tRNA-2-methylthio-N6-dimethylallyladenosine synthase
LCDEFFGHEIVTHIVRNGYNTTQVRRSRFGFGKHLSIRDKAEQTVQKRLEKYNAVKRINPKMKVGVLGWQSV